MSTRKELIAEGKDITPLTREEYFLAGKDLEPLNVKEKVLKGVVGGGGGSGDFTTAKVTFVNSAEGKGGAVQEFVHISDGNGINASEIRVGDTEGVDVIAVLYKGNYIYSINDLEDIDLTAIHSAGDMRYEPDFGQFVIYGDCTITVKCTGESPT